MKQACGHCYSLKNFREHVYHRYISAKFVKNQKHWSIAEKKLKSRHQQAYIDLVTENLFRTLCSNIQNHKNDQFVTTLIVQLV